MEKSFGIMFICFTFLLLLIPFLGLGYETYIHAKEREACLQQKEPTPLCQIVIERFKKK